MARFAKFDPRAFLESEKGAAENAGVHQTAEDQVPPASETLATLATLAASTSKNEKLDVVRSSAAVGQHSRSEAGKFELDPAKVAKVAKVKASVPAIEEAVWGEAEEERAAIAEHDGGAPRVWAEALARLDPARPPCDVPPTRWLRFIDDCGLFLDEGWAARAEALGWGPLDLFGCSRDKPFARISQAGLLWLLEGRKLHAMTADTAVFAKQSGGKLTFYRQQLEAGGVLAWELGAAE
jgi:hypothetical protein